jgi:hypothetical protein
MSMRLGFPRVHYVLTAALGAATALAQPPDPAEYAERSRRVSAQMESRGLADAFVGVTTAGKTEEGLFPIRSDGVDTAPAVRAATAFLDALLPGQREQTQFGVDDAEWRKWGNQHIYRRQGTSFAEMTAAQRDAAWRMLDASLSARGLALVRDIMRLNETLGELNGDNFVEYGEDKYWLTVMGTPSADEPWGWQLDGHHLIINCFVLGDQVVMTPAFWGSEPAVATSGKYAGTRIMDAEQQEALALVRTLDAAQRTKAVLMDNKTGNNILTQAFSDNVVLDYAGIAATELTQAQRSQLMSLIGLYVGNMESDAAAVKMAEVEQHLDGTWFAWIGDTADDAVFYYRIQSPVLLIEFDHETPVGLTHLYPRGVPYREHIHSVVRTPNGNDYGKDLLRQHYALHPH